MYLFIPLPLTWFHLWVDTCLSFVEFLCRSIWHMFPERKLWHEELKAFNRIVVEETCVIVIAKVVWISKMIVTHFAQSETVHAHHVANFIQPVVYSAWRSRVADRCHCLVPEMFVDSSCRQVVLDTPVAQSILRLTGNWWQLICFMAEDIDRLIAIRISG